MCIFGVAVLTPSEWLGVEYMLRDFGQGRGGKVARARAD